MHSIILQNKNLYFKLISGNIDQLSDLRKCLLELHADEKFVNIEFKSFIEGLGITEKNKQQEI